MHTPKLYTREEILDNTIDALKNSLREAIEAQDRECLLLEEINTKIRNWGHVITKCEIGIKELTEERDSLNNDL